MADDLLTPFSEALASLQERAEDADLRARVVEYFSDDIPAYFLNNPILYLARHVPTPNFETLRFLHLVEPLGMTAVIGKDSEDIFVPKNAMKRALCKMPICTRVRRLDGTWIEDYHNVTIVDFNKAAGQKFSEIKTMWGENLIDFHTELFNQFTKYDVHIENDADWISRQSRGDILEHYKKMLALFICHGISFETYIADDGEEARFVDEILRPAFLFVKEHFGLRPLITSLHPTNMESSKFWISYPKEVIDVVKRKMPGTLGGN